MYLSLKSVYTHVFDKNYKTEQYLTALAVLVLCFLQAVVITPILLFIIQQNLCSESQTTRMRG